MCICFYVWNSGVTVLTQAFQRDSFAMTWEEIVRLFISFGENVHIVRGDGLDAVSLQIAPIAWFISMKATGQLNIGIYEGEENRLVGTRAIPFAELTSEFLRSQVQEALAKQVTAMLDPDAVQDFLSVRENKTHRRFPPPTPRC